MSLPKSILSLAILTVLAPPGLAQPAATTTYELGPKSTYQQGCFPPCMCPLGPELPILGTFKLAYKGFSDWYDHYEITEVGWEVRTSDRSIRLAGSGTYRIGGDFALSQQMTLDLSTNGGPPEHFDSAMVLGGGLPAIDITVSINQMFCQDTAIHVIATPQPVPPPVLYRLLPKSTYQEGCFGLCDCILYPEAPITGTFRLSPGDSNPLYQSYYITDVDWRSFAGTQARQLTGKGVYKVGGEVAMTQQLELDLCVDGNPPEHFDSGVVPGGATFPFLDIQVTIGQLVCFDRPIHLVADPLGDFNLDGSVDGADLDWFLKCITGPAVSLISPGCTAADLDGDGDVDQDDFGILQRCWSGSGVPADPNCAN